MIARLSERAITALCLLLIGVALLLSTAGLEFAELGGAFSPTFFPRIVLMLWIVLATLGLAAELWTPTPSGSLRLLRLGVLALGLLAYVLMLKTLGFFLASAGFCVLGLLLLGIRNPLAVGLFALGLPGALVVLFNHLLILPLPTSPFTHLF